MKEVLLVLAGGRGTRMGGPDKPLERVGGKTLLAHVLDRLNQPWQARLVSVNATPQRYAAFDVILLPDTVAGHPGPLAGILAGLEWLERESPTADLLVVPADTPFIPHDLLPRLRTARTEQNTLLACASVAGRCHPTIGLWRASHAPAVRLALAGNERRVGKLMRTIGLGIAEFDAGLANQFLNVNTREDLARAKLLYQAGQETPPGVTDGKAT